MIREILHQEKEEQECRTGRDSVDKKQRQPSQDDSGISAKCSPESDEIGQGLWVWPRKVWLIMVHWGAVAAASNTKLQSGAYGTDTMQAHKFLSERRLGFPLLTALEGPSLYKKIPANPRRRQRKCRVSRRGRSESISGCNTKLWELNHNLCCPTW